MSNKVEYCQCCKLKKGKECKKCGEVRALTEFHKGKSACKLCRREVAAKSYLNKKLLEATVQE